MPLIAYGINHQSTPIAVREKLAFNSEQLIIALQTLIKHTAVEEAIILSTCHRTEIYVQLSDYFSLRQWLQQQKSLAQDTLNAYDYTYHEIDAIKHIMRVASGLNSMIVGEPQIFGQLKQAYQTAQTAGTVGQRFQQLFNTVFKAGKYIRTHTSICAHPVSLSYVVTQLLKKYHGSLLPCRVLLIGAGEIIQLIATHLQNQVQQLFITNRTIKKASDIAEQSQATVIPMQQFPDVLNTVDIVISAIQTEEYVIHAKMIHHPLFLIDLGLPRNIDPAISLLNNITLYNIDDLQQIIDTNLQHKQQAVSQAENLIEQYANKFIQKEKINHAHHVISCFRNRLESIQHVELQKALHQLQSGRDPVTVLQTFGRSLINKMMHQPTIKLRTAASDARTETLEAAKFLFELE